MSSFRVKDLLGKSLLFADDLLDPLDVLEFHVQSNLFHLLGLLKGKDVDFAIKKLSTKTNGGVTGAIDANISMGLLGGLLLLPEDRRSLFFCARSIFGDNWSVFVDQLKYFTFTKFNVLKPDIRKNLLWLVQHLTLLCVPGTDALILGILRNIEDEPRKFELVSDILVMVNKSIDWILTREKLVPHLALFLAKCLSERICPPPLRKNLMGTLLDITTKGFEACRIIGRELFRRLVEISNPDLEPIWRLLWREFTDKSIPPVPKNILSIYFSAKVEQAIYFLMEVTIKEKLCFYWELYFDVYRKNSLWMNDGHLTDMIRFITSTSSFSTAITTTTTTAAPTTKKTTLSCADNRWNLITLILKSQSDAVGASAAKLALFIDCLFFECESNSSLSIVEAALQTIIKNISSAPYISATLIEFLYLSITNFCPPLEERMRNSVKLAISNSKFSKEFNGLLTSPSLPEDVKTMASRMILGLKVNGSPS